MSNGNISIEKLRAKLGEKEVQMLLYEQILEQYKLDNDELKKKNEELKNQLNDTTG